MTPSVANNWYLQGTLYFTTANTQKAVVTIFDGTAQEVIITKTLDQNLAVDNTLRLMGEGVATNDIVMEAFKIWWEPSNT